MTASAGSGAGRDLTPTVFVVDDDVSVRESLELMIRTAGWEPEVFSSALEFLAHPRVDVPRCLVLDMSLPGLNGLDLQGRIASDQPYMPIIFITGHGDVPSSVQAMKAGAFDFLTKPFREDVLLEAIGNAVSRSREALRERADLQSLRSCYATLTSREREVMERVTSGMLNKQVADELGISLITVKAHRGSMMRKMSVASIAELVQIAAKLGLPSARGTIAASTDTNAQ